MNSSQATGRASELPDYGLPGNDLNPNTPTPDQQKKIPFIIKVYGLLCMIDGIVTLPVVAIFLGMIAWALGADPEAISIGTDPTLPVIIVALSIVVTVINSVGLIVFGRSLLKSRRRHAARWSYLLLATTFVQLLFNVMLSGIGTNLISDIIQFFILLALSITIDPSLREERMLQRRLRDLTDQEAAEEGMLGRDLEGKGYIQLNFFNLFWVFMVCCVLGLIIEVIYHMVVVDPGVYQDRAGLLFGPFSPIYGCGAVLLTIALNRLQGKPHHHLHCVRHHRRRVRGVRKLVYADGLRRRCLGLHRNDALRHPRPHRHRISGAHQHPVHVHVGRAWLRMDQALLAVAPEAHQHDSMEAALLTHHRVRSAHARQRRHDASGARLLVRTRLGHLCQHARGRVLCRALR